MKSFKKKQLKITTAQRTAAVQKQRAIIGGVSAFILLYLCIAAYFAGHFFPKTLVNGTAVGGMSQKAAVKVLQESANHYSLLMEGPEGKTELLEDPNLNVVITDGSALKTLLFSQNALLWPVGLFGTKTYDCGLTASYNEVALAADLAGIGMLDTDTMREPQNARLEKDENGNAQIIPEDEGNTLDVGMAKAQIREAVGSAITHVDLTKSQVLPTVRESDESLQQRLNQWNQYMKAAGLTYRIITREEVIDRKTLAGFLVDDGESISISEDEVIGLMAVWRERYNTYRSPFRFVTFRKKEITIEPYGDYGYELNDEDMTKDIISRIKNGDHGTYDALWYHEAPYKENNGLGENYVEISIDEQRLWVWKDGQVVVDTSVVTGWPVHGSTTYHGCYAIKSKNRNVTLGEQDVQGYANPVDYWIPFNGGEGMHDAPWRDYFGGKIWIENGSHGCVNVPVEVMGDVFDNVEVGEAVVIYGKDYNEEVNDIDNKEPTYDYYYDVYYGGE